MAIPQMMGQMAIQGMMNKLQKQNPQMYQMLQQARRNGTNAQDLFKQITKGYTPQQLEEFFSQARQYGFSEDVINQLRY